MGGRAYIRGIALICASAFGVLAHGQAKVTIRPGADGKGFIAKTPAYAAQVRADGSLHSLVVKGIELLDDSVGNSRGAYLYAGKPVQFAKVEKIDASTIKASAPDAELTYKFVANAITIEATQSRTASGRVFVMLSKAFERANNVSGFGSVKGIVNGPWRAVRFVTSKGPVLQIGGLTRLWGPWPNAKDGRQVCQADVLKGKKRIVRLAVALAPAPGDLVELKMACPQPDFIFAPGEKPSVTVEVVNGGAGFESMITCTLMTFDHKPLAARSQPVRVEGGKSAKATFPLPEAREPGFYDVSAEFRQGKYMVRKEIATIGVAPGEIQRPTYREPDFEEFWKATLAELQTVPLDAHLKLVAEKTDDDVKTYKVNFAGLDGSRWYAWYCAPKVRGVSPAVVVFPGYGDHGIVAPVEWARKGYAALAVQVRERDVDLPHYEGKRYMLEGIEAKEKYVYRGIYAAGVRCVDFLRSRPEVNPEGIAVTGHSQGGGLSLATAALDGRVQLCMADVPFLCDFPDAIGMAGLPYREVADYLKQHPDRREKALRVLSYFDAMNLAPEIKCPVLMSVGLRDRTCPPVTVYAAFNRISSRKEMSVYPSMGHANPLQQVPVKEQWMEDFLPPVAPVAR